MIAYWMASSVLPGQDIDSEEFDSFCSRLLDRSIGQFKSGGVAFQDGAGIALFEVSLELVRLTEFPSRPSRLRSLFLWPTLDVARSYHNRVPYASVYEVEIVAERNSFRGNFDLITSYPSRLNLASFFETARLYWRGEEEGKRTEIVLDGGISVVREAY